MFTVKNLRKESVKGWTYLKCDFSVTGIKSPFQEDTMWVAVEDRNFDMLSDRVYDPFVLLPVYLGMHYKQDVHIEGPISPRLYHNMTHYVMNIFDRFSDYTAPIKFTVDGFDTVEEGPSNLISTGISCGVDSLVTVYDNYVMEDDPNFKINSLLFTNCGSHGDFEDPNSRKLWLDRTAMNRKAAEELDLPVYLVDSNLHAFTHIIGGQKIGYLAFYSCALSLQKYIKRYLTSSNVSYDELTWKNSLSRDVDIAEYSESYMPHLVSTERFELVIDGCQYTRAEKLERIAGWDLARKYLNVCIDPKDHSRNCSNCEKCMRTLIQLDAMGKLDIFKNVFDFDVYRRNVHKWKCKFVADQNKNKMEAFVIQYSKKHDMSFPAYVYAKPYTLARKVCGKIKRRIAKSHG